MTRQLFARGDPAIEDRLERARIRQSSPTGAATNPDIQVVVEGLHTLWLGLAIAFGIFSAINAIKLPSHAAPTVASFNAALSMVFLTLWLTRWRVPTPPRWANALVAGSLLLAVTNVLTAFALAGEPLRNTFISFFLIAAGSFLLSTRWLAATIGAIFACWVPVASSVSSSSDELIQYALTLLAGTILAATIHAARLKTHRRLSVALGDLSSAVAELKISENRYRRLFGQSKDIVGISTLEGRLIDINQAGVELLGYSTKDELIGADLATRVYADPLERKQLVEALLEKGYVRDHQSTLTTRAGRVITVEGTTSMIQGEDGEGIKFLAILRDVTKRKQEQEELERHRLHLEDMVARRTAKLAEEILERQRIEKEKLQMEVQFQKTQKLESLGVLASGIAHDFNNLLVGIMGNAGLMNRDLPQDSRYRAHVEQIELAAKRAAELVEQMLAFAGKSQLVFKSLDLRHLVEEMTKLLETSISKKATLTFSVADDLPAIEGDATQIRQVIMNLLTNASEAFSQDRGAIAVRIGVEDAAAIDRSQAQQNLDAPAAERYLFLEVSDTGSGMDETTRERMFDPFYTTKFEGRGLGMAAVLGIVRAHLGLIVVDSEPGEGSTIKVLFPASETSVTPSSSVDKEDPRSSHEGKIGVGTVLVVDDEEVVRFLAKACLESEGLDVLTVEDGLQAVELLSQNPDTIDLVLLDYRMPNLDGEETFRELRRIRPDIKIILSSGAQEQDATQDLLSAGLAGFVPKPFQPEVLIRTVAEVLGR